MPEGHTIHRAARDHHRDLAGQRVAISSPQGRLNVEDLADEDGRALLLRVEAYGKHLFYFFEHGHIVHVHLGLFGKFWRRKNPAPEPRTTTRMRLEGETITLDLVGPTACELVSEEEMQAITSRIGPDPLRDDVDPKPFYKYLARSKSSIGAVLLDQSVISGVGNVYRAEVLHLLGIHPLTPSREIDKKVVRKMWKLISGLLKRGVEEKRIVTTQGLVLPKPRKRVTRAESTHVYRRKTCRSCEDQVRTITLRARRIYYCESCQPLDVEVLDASGA